MTKPPAATPAPAPAPSPVAPGDLSLRELTDLFLQDEAIIRRGGGKAAVDRQHEKGRLTARERIDLLVDEKGAGGFAEFGLWCAWGMYQVFGGAPAAGVVTGIGRVQGRQHVIIANDATVKAGAFFPMTCKKIIRAQTIAMMARLPLIYLVDSAGVFLPLQEDVFPDTDDFGRIFRNNAVISAMGIPQIAAIMGYCVAGGGYLPVLCDTLLMTEGSGLYLAGPALVKAAIGQDVTDEELGGASMHASVSGTIDFKEKDDPACISRLRELISKYPPDLAYGWVAHLARTMSRYQATMIEPMRDHAKQFERVARENAVDTRSVEAMKEDAAKRMAESQARREAMVQMMADHNTPAKFRELFEELGGPRFFASDRTPAAPARAADEVYSVFTDKPGAQYDVRDVIACFVDSRADAPSAQADFDEYKADFGQSIVCGYASVGGFACGIVANQRKVSTTLTAGGKAGPGKRVNMPGVIYDDSADKSARFIMDCNQRKIPIVFLHDTTGFMVGRDSEQGGIIRAGAKMVNAMSNSIVPKIVVIMGGSYGAGNYAMCGRAFDPFISLAWPNAKCAVMGANQATGVLAMIEEKARERRGEKIDEKAHKEILAAVHAGYTEQADIRHGAARGWVDRLIAPHKTRDELISALDAAQQGWDYSKEFKVGVLQT